MKKTDRTRMAGVLLSALWAWQPAAAQVQQPDTTLQRTVVVEQEYAPDIERATKINVLPQVEAPAAVKREVEYATALKPATEIPTATLEGYAGSDAGGKALPGYVRAGYGNYGNVDVLANYLFRPAANDKLGVNFAFDGMNGELELPEEDNYPWKTHYYRTRAAVNYAHAFTKAELAAGGNVGLSNFSLINSRQRYTSGDLGLSVCSTDKNLPLQYRAETRAYYYERAYNQGTSALQEYQLRTTGEAFAPIDEDRQVGVAFAMHNLFYNCDDFDYTTIDLNPYYTFTGGRWNMRIGIHADLAFKMGKKLQVAPDVTVQFAPTEQTALYVQATGGRRLNDFRKMEEVSPFAEVASPLPAAYEQLNAAGGFRMGTSVGLSMHLYGGLQWMKDELVAVYDNLSFTSPWGRLVYRQGDLKHGYVGLEADYHYRESYSLHGSVVYRKWEKESEGLGESDLYFLPALEADCYIDARPLAGLQLRLGYRHIARSANDARGGSKADPVGNLYLGGSYELFGGVTVYARANNILNKSYQYHWGYPAEKFNLLGGVAFRF